MMTTEYADDVEAPDDSGADKCSKCGDPSEGYHTCPYDEEINHCEVECNCCSTCTNHCLMDI